MITQTEPTMPRVSHQNAIFWDKIAEGYSQKPVADPLAFERKIVATREQMDREHVILDVGCGTGSLALLLSPHAKHVHGLDISGEMVRIARKKATERNAQNVTFHIGDFDSKVPFAKASLDGICAYSLLHLLQDPAEALERIYSLLRPGGFFVASTVCLKESRVPYRPLLKAMRWLGKAPFVNVISKKELLELLEEAGFVSTRSPDVGASSEIAFTIAQKPGLTKP
jgi:arsenite methyltransferase